MVFKVKTEGQETQQSAVHISRTEKKQNKSILNLFEFSDFLQTFHTRRFEGISPELVYLLILNGYYKI